MKIKQIAVFIENKAGRINEIANILGSANINTYAFSIGENSEFGIVRLIVSDLDKAVEELRKGRFMVNISEVFCLKIENYPGSMAKALNILAENNISIEYMYAFTQENSAYIIVRPDNMENAMQGLLKSDIQLISSKELMTL